jgi:hypothetical protein
MLVVTLGCDRRFKLGEVVNVKTINNAIEAEFNTRLVSQAGRTLVLSSPRMIRCSHGSDAPRYLVPEADVVVFGEGTTSMAKCLDVSKTGLGLRTSNCLLVGKPYRIAYEVPGYTFQLYVECAFCQQISLDGFRAGMQILSSDRCDTGRWQRFVEAVSRQTKIDLSNTLRLMYLPEPSATSTIKP